MSKKLIAARQRELDQARDYVTWREIATELDRLEGAEAWKQDEASDDYDHLLIHERLSLMRQLRAVGDARQLAFHLAESLHGNLGNTANPALYVFARIGTKQLIHDYVAEAAQCLNWICDTPNVDFSLDEKMLFFKRTGTSFGRSALLLSGGATLGMFHLGVIRALWDQRLLPRVISGSSAGAIIAAVVGTRTDEEIPSIFEAGSFNLHAFESVGLTRLMRGGTLMDPARLEECISCNVHAGSFQEAFERTRRIIGITVSPAEPNQQPRLLNYLTAPHAVIRRAVLASCAIPGVFPPVMLEALDYSGEAVPYMRSKRWVDGTLSNDLPLLRLARLHNVNHYIVSQTNPHVAPFMSEDNPRQRGLYKFATEMARVASRDVLKVTRDHFGGTGTMRIVDFLNEVMQQRYSGDVSIFPRHSPQQLLRMLSNPTAEEIDAFMVEGERATWPKIERIRIQTSISRAFEQCLVRLKEQQRVLMTGEPQARSLTLDASGAATA